MFRCDDEQYDFAKKFLHGRAWDWMHDDAKSHRNLSHVDFSSRYPDIERLLNWSETLIAMSQVLREGTAV